MVAVLRPGPELLVYDRSDIADGSGTTVFGLLALHRARLANTCN
jgi:hypothetical protein